MGRQAQRRLCCDQLKDLKGKKAAAKKVRDAKNKKNAVGRGKACVWGQFLVCAATAARDRLVGPKKHVWSCDRPKPREAWTLSLEAIPQTDSIAPGRVLTLVRPGNDLVLRRIRNLKCCVQVCCNKTTPRYACNLPASCISASQALQG